MLVFDCDPGTDDACALFVMMRHGMQPDVCLSTYGNASLATTHRNLRLLVSYFGATSRLAKGCEASLSGTIPSCGGFHGSDGLAEVSSELASSYIPNMENAPMDLSDVAKAILSSYSVTYIVTAPLTNLATLLDQYPQIKSHIRQVYAMGGGLHWFNMKHQTEYNFYSDPKAVQKILASGLDMTLFPLDLTQTKAILTASQIDALAQMGTCRPMIRILRQIHDANVNLEGSPGAVVHDLLPVLYALDKSSFSITDMHLLVDKWGHIYENPRGYMVHVATGLDTAAFYQSICQSFGACQSNCISDDFL